MKRRTKEMRVEKHANVGHVGSMGTAWLHPGCADLTSKNQNRKRKIACSPAYMVSVSSPFLAISSKEETAKPGNSWAIHRWSPAALGGGQFPSNL
eukprot:1159061-Pelagomonas_calceolata.AAC.14